MTASDYALIIQLFAMLILVCVTIYYAKQTKRMAEEMKLQRLVAAPFVVPEFDVFNPQEPYVKTTEFGPYVTFPVSMTNVGTASAIDIELSLKLPTNNEKFQVRPMRLPLLLPDAHWIGQRE